MTSDTRQSVGFSVRDGVAIIVAAAISSVHMRIPVTRAMGGGWGLVWITFAGVGLTSAGPLVLLTRHFVAKPRIPAPMGDRLWALLGVPWIVTAPLRASSSGGTSGPSTLYGMLLVLLVGSACLLTLVSLWTTWVMRPPVVRDDRDDPKSWTENLGMTIAVAWPLQIGFLLIVADSDGVPNFPG